MSGLVTQYMQQSEYLVKVCGRVGEKTGTFFFGRFRLVVMLQLPDLSLVAVDLALQTLNLLFVVVNFLLVMLLQCSQLLLLLTPDDEQMNR